MNKYLSFEIEDLPAAQVAINGGLTVGVQTATNIALHSADSAVVYTIVGTGFTVAMETAINYAIVHAAETNWTNVVSKVDIPSIRKVTNVTIA